VFAENGVIYAAENGRVEPIMRTSEIFLPGVHNIENYMAAFAAVKDLVGHETMRSVAMEFRGVAHRIEYVRTLRGVRYYNDSIASSPTRTIAGLRSFDQKVILIAEEKTKAYPSTSWAGNHHARQNAYPDGADGGENQKGRGERPQLRRDA
jgi:UDP-N-acetylmuramoylalanine--D-glutamate ligase